MEYLMLLLCAGVGVSSYIIGRKYLIYGFERDNTSIQISTLVYVLVCISSVGLLQMLLIEVVQIYSSTTRYNLWIFCIWLLNYNILYTIPGLLILRSISRHDFDTLKKKTLIFLAAYSFYFFPLAYFLKKEHASLYGEGPYYFSNISGLLNEAAQFNLISKVGVCIISSLSGFSIVYMPFEYFKYYNPLISTINKSKIQDELSAFINSIRNNKIRLARISAEDRLAGRQETEEGTGGLIKRLFGRKMNKQEKEINEIKMTLKTQQQQMNILFIDYIDICKEEQNYDSVHRDRLWSFINRALAIALIVFGLYKIFNTLYSILLGRNLPVDPITLGMRYFYKYASGELDQKTSDMIVSYSSLTFIGVLIITNVRGFAMTAHKFLRIYFGSFLSQFISSESILLVTTLIVGVYFVSTFFLMQYSLPHVYTVNIKWLTTKIQYHSIYFIFDIVFLVSSCVWGLVLYVNIRNRHRKYYSYAQKLK